LGCEEEVEVEVEDRERWHSALMALNEPHPHPDVRRVACPEVLVKATRFVVLVTKCVVVLCRNRRAVKDVKKMGLLDGMSLGHRGTCNRYTKDAGSTAETERERQLDAQ
jgi:hypothetical protein